MNNPIVKIKLGDVIDVKRGTSLSGDNFSGSGEYIRLTLGNFCYPQCGWKENTSKKDLYYIGPFRKEFLMECGDIITPLTEQVKGLLGNTATIPESGKYIQSGDVGKIIANEKVLNKRFSYYLVSSPVVKRQLAASSQQTKIRHTSPDKIKECFAFMPKDLDEQKKIASALDSISDKIAINRKINSELESMAKTIYDYWFLQFEFPNEEGKPYKSSGGKMAWNAKLKREIPEGWRVFDLISSPLCRDIKAGVDLFETKNYLPTANIEGELITDGENITYKNRESRANMQPAKCSVWFAKMKNSIKHLSIPSNGDWFVNKYILSTGFQGLQCDERSFAYIHCFINQKWFERKKDTLSHGATQQGVNLEDLKSVLIPVPSYDILANFSSAISPLLEIKFNNIRENQELASLRDFLLPLLMNGQATI